MLAGRTNTTNIVSLSHLTMCKLAFSGVVYSCSQGLTVWFLRLAFQHTISSHASPLGVGVVHRHIPPIRLTQNVFWYHDKYLQMNSVLFPRAKDMVSWWCQKKKTADYQCKVIPSSSILQQENTSTIFHLFLSATAGWDHSHQNIAVRSMFLIIADS